MINFRLCDYNIDALLEFVNGKFPLTEEVARSICVGIHPVVPCTQVYGAFFNENGKSELVSIMTATYCLVFPHKDGTRMVHISGAYTKDKFRHQGYASALLRAIEKDATDFFHADYLCCDSTVNELYEKHGFTTAPDGETRLWKRLTTAKQKILT